MKDLRVSSDELDLEPFDQEEDETLSAVFLSWVDDLKAKGLSCSSEATKLT